MRPRGTLSAPFPTSSPAPVPVIFCTIVWGEAEKENKQEK